MNNPRYLQIADGSELWDDVRQFVVNSVTVEEFDMLVDAGYLDLDGLVLVDADNQAD